MDNQHSTSILHKPLSEVSDYSEFFSVFETDEDIIPKGVAGRYISSGFKEDMRPKVELYHDVIDRVSYTLSNVKLNVNHKCISLESLCGKRLICKQCRVMRPKDRDNYIYDSNSDYSYDPICRGCISTKNVVSKGVVSMLEELYGDMRSQCQRKHLCIGFTCEEFIATCASGIDSNYDDVGTDYIHRYFRSPFVPSRLYNPVDLYESWVNVGASVAMKPTARLRDRSISRGDAVYVSSFNFYPRSNPTVASIEPIGLFDLRTGEIVSVEWNFDNLAVFLGVEVSYIKDVMFHRHGKPVIKNYRLRII